MMNADQYLAIAVVGSVAQYTLSLMIETSHYLGS